MQNLGFLENFYQRFLPAETLPRMVKNLKLFPLDLGCKREIFALEFGGPVPIVPTQLRRP